MTFRLLFFVFMAFIWCPLFAQEKAPHIDGPFKIGETHRYRLITPKEIIKRETAKPLHQRAVISLSEIQIGYVTVPDTLKEARNTSPAEYKSPLTPNEQRIFNDALNQLPKPFHDLLKKCLIAFYFSDHTNRPAHLSPFFRRGFRQGFLNTFGTSGYIVLTFSRDIFHQTLYDFVNQRERAIFDAPDTAPYQIEIQTSKNISALWFVLMQKTAEFYRQTYSTRVFTETVWESFHQPMDPYRFDNRDAGKPSRNRPQLTIDQAEQIYRNLAQTPFVSLHGSRTLATDFVEFATFYHLTQTLNAPYQITLTNPTGDSFTYAPFANTQTKNRVPLLHQVLSP